MTESRFIEELKKINITLTDTMLEQLNKYYELLVEWNEKINLTSIIKKEDVYLKHFYDSLTITKVIDLTKEETLCDIGTGAGFPGLVLKIVFPNLKITLVDALEKRIKFLNLVIKELNLKDIETVHARSEEYAKTNRNKFDITTARAVANLSVLLEYAIPMTKENKYFIPLKANVQEELQNIDHALKELNTELVIKKELTLPIEESMRTILKFKKVSDNKKYPRKNSEIKKNRL